MKNSKLVIGILIGFGAFALLSAGMKPAVTENAVARYHMFVVADGNAYVSDAVTGEYKRVNYKTDVKVGHSMKELLAK